MKNLAVTLISFITLFGIARAQDKLLIEPVNTVITNYLAVKNGLAAGDGKIAQAKAKELLNALNAVPAQSLKSDESALMSKLQYDSRHISEMEVVAHQREHFASLSDNLYALLKKLKVNTAVLYRQYCSMSKNYYLSDVQKDKDPYMGMDNCSKVKETLPVAKN